MRCDITREEIEICREKIMAGSLGQWLGFSLALGLGLFCLPQSEAPQPATSAYNLAPNPSFEGGSPRAQLLYQQAFPVFDWEPAWSVGEYRWEEGEAWEGERSLALLGTVKEDGTWAQGGWVTRFGFPAFPAYTYTFSGWVKTEQASGHTHLVIGWFGPQGWVSNTDNGFFLGGDREWVRLSVRGRPPEGATYGRLYFRSDGNWGGAWFDGAKLQLGEGPGEIAVPNGSFEVVGEKGIEGWETWPEEGWGEVVEGTEMAYEGERCVGLGEVVGRIGWVSERFHVSGGGAWEYEVGVRVNGKEVKEGQVRIGIKWEGEEEGLEVSEGLEVGGKGWQEVRHRTGVPEGVEWGRIVLLGEELRGRVRFDGVRLRVWEGGSPSAKVPLGVAIARCYLALQEHLAPDRLGEVWEEAFGAGEEVEKIVEEIEAYRSREELDRDMRRFLGMANYHLGRYEEALRWLRPLHRAYGVNDVRNDAVWHYEYWAKEGTQGEEVKPSPAAGGEESLPSAELAGPSPVVYIGDDTETQGDWIGRYGKYAYVLCGINQYNVTGGIGWPVPLRFYTGNPAEPGRRYIVALETEEIAALYNPLTFKRRMAYWDDRGEVYVKEGPDILFDLGVPKGTYLLSLYAREHRLTIKERKGETLGTAPRVRMEGARYRRFVVKGPLELTVRLHRDESIATILHGIFLDPVETPLPGQVLGHIAGLDEPLPGEVGRQYEAWRRRVEQEVDYRTPPFSRQITNPLESYLAENPPAARTAWVYLLLWQVHRHSFQWKAAERALQQAISWLRMKSRERVREGLKQLADICEGHGWLWEEAYVLAALVEEETEPAEKLAGLQRLARVYEQLGRELWKERMEVYQAILALAREPAVGAEVLYRVAVSALAAGEEEVASQRFRELVESYPQTVEALWAREHLAFMHRRKEKRDETKE